MPMPAPPSPSPYAPQMQRPNAAAKRLDREYDLFVRIAGSGGLQQICCPPSYLYEKPPYLVMPPEGRQYQEINSIALPANNGTDTVVTTFKVPTGYDGVITSIVNMYTGAGFVEGSGNLTWRIMVGRRWGRNLGSIQTTLGSLTSPCPLFRGGIRVCSQQVCTYYVNHAVASALAGGRIVCAFFGWFYPI